jgi:hypothetical protein
MRSNSESRPQTRGRRTNLALLLLVPLAILTGLIANTAGTRWGIHPSVLHGVIAFAIVALIPWKQTVVRRGLTKRKKTPWVSLILLVLVLSTLTTGFMHALGYRGDIGPLTLMQVHIGGALIALVLVWLHYRAHPVRMVRSVDLERRGFIRTAAFATAAGVAWLSLERTLDALDLRGGERRFTGSHEKGSFDPRGFPVTSWLDDRVQQIDGDRWVVHVEGNPLRLADLRSMSGESFDAVLDCTSAWYTEQEWSGIRLDHLLEVDGRRSIVVTSQTGYARRFPAGDVEKLWLVTGVGGEPLSAGHGFPARIVAPGRRGFWWVKWVTDIETSDVPWWVQLPFPAT